MNPTDYFAEIAPVTFKGPDNHDELSYRFYDKNRIVLGKRMEDHLRFAVCFWHSFCWNGFDVFGAGTFNRPWHAGANDADAARFKRAVAFDFFNKLDLPFYAFHDVDVMAATETVCVAVSLAVALGLAVGDAVDVAVGVASCLDLSVAEFSFVPPNSAIGMLTVSHDTAVATPAHTADS